MKKKVILLLLVGLMVTMIGCGEASKSNTQSNPTSTSSTESKDTKKEEPKKEEVKENRQTVLDNATAKVEYIKTAKDEMGTHMYFHVENKIDKKIVVQPEQSISLDDKMYCAFASQDVLGKKQADFKVDLGGTDGSEVKIPDFKKASGTMNISDENFELISQQTFDISK